MWSFICDSLRGEDVLNSPVSLSTWDTSLLFELSMRFVLRELGDKRKTINNMCWEVLSQKVPNYHHYFIYIFLLILFVFVFLFVCYSCIIFILFLSCIDCFCLCCRCSHYGCNKWLFQFHDQSANYLMYATDRFISQSVKCETCNN